MNNKSRHSKKKNGAISPLHNKLSNIPDQPGVYLFRDYQESILYIGKSKSLKNRIRSYFQNSARHNSRIRILVSLIMW